MLGLWEKPAAQIRPQPFAFRTGIEDVLTRAVPHLKERGLHPSNFLDDGSERPMVFGWMPIPGKGGPQLHLDETNNWPPSLEDCQFCFAFAVDSTLQLQEVV